MRVAPIICENHWRDETTPFRQVSFQTPSSLRSLTHICPLPPLLCLLSQLNPGGTLNYKYQAEAAVRASGLPYSVIRSTGEQIEQQGRAGSKGASQSGLPWDCATAPPQPSPHAAPHPFTFLPCRYD